ncbi:hypothetical protein FRC12_013375 [Ceratobasidium sp. 428]|nr:hypothetical protein FRC12_013375 [Ceratobasidium sp. 428]
MYLKLRYPYFGLVTGQLCILQAPTMASARAKVLQLPELLYSISAHADSRCLINLMATSKMFFSAAAPHAWETVSGAAPLFQFLPCRISQKEVSVDTLCYYGSFTFNTPLSEFDLGRLSIYAPYVKHLDLFRFEDNLKLTYGWEVLFDFVNAGHTLLPNLVTLSLKPPLRYLCPSIQPYPWILVFCSHTLKSVSIDASLGKISPRVGSGLCHLLFGRCPNLAVLEFDLLSEEIESDQDKYLSPRSDQTDHIPNLLRNGLTLQHLSVSVCFVNKYLLLISQMHNLQSLEVRDKERSPISVQTKLSLSSFPALTALVFSEMDLLKVEVFWERMPELFARLTRLKCVLDADQNNENRERTLGFPLRFATALKSKGPNITDLEIRFNPGDFYIATSLLRIDKDTLQMLAMLPLQRLSVQSIMIGESEYYNGGETCRLLASTFPDIEILRWIYHSGVGREDLQAFTDMPKLRHLGLCVNKGQAKANTGSAYSGDMNRPRTPLRILEVDIGFDGWLPVVEYYLRGLYAATLAYCSWFIGILLVFGRTYG